jgi:hypothetical protein
LVKQQTVESEIRSPDRQDMVQTAQAEGFITVCTGKKASGRKPEADRTGITGGNVERRKP